MAGKVSKAQQAVLNLLSDLHEFLKTQSPDTEKGMVFDAFQIPFFILDDDKRVGTGRVAFYEHTDEPDETLIGWSRPDETNQTYYVDISVPMVYLRTRKIQPYQRARSIRDLVIEWVKQVDVYTPSDGILLAARYAGTISDERGESVSHLRVAIVCRKDLIKNQF